MLENKLPFIGDRRQTDRVTILANHNPVTLTADLDLQFLTSYGHEPLTSRNRDQKSVG